MTLIDVVVLLVWALYLLLLVPTLVFVLEIVLAYIFNTKHNRDIKEFHQNPSGWQRGIVLIPAHNEQAVIAATLNCLKGRPDSIRVLVVADNCTDQTAQLAISCGAEVIERQSDTQRGKGFALQFGIDYIKSEGVDSPDVLMVMDADCLISMDDMVSLLNECARVNAPVQAWCAMKAPNSAGPALKLAEFAWVVKTLVRPMGAARLGMPNHITGTGFALPWSVANQVSLASGHLVEDMQLTLDLAQQRVAVMLVPTIRLESFFPNGGDAQVTQSSRWVHGHLGMLMTTIPKCVAQGLLTFNRTLFLIALDAAVPPLSLLVFAQACFFLFAWVMQLTGVVSGLMWVSLVANFLLFIGLVLAWDGWGKNILTLGDIRQVPAFAARKLFIFRRFVSSRETGWTRTERD